MKSLAAALLLLFFSSSVVAEGCALPEADDRPDNMAPPAIEGRITQVSPESISVKAPKEKTSRSVRLTDKTAYFTQDGGWVDPKKLNTQQYAWVWLVECGAYDQGKTSEAAVVMVNVR
jgi:hypothetical protein